MAIPSRAASTTVESPAGMNVFAGQAKPVAPSLGRASQPIRLPADSEPPAAHSCSRMTSATADRSGRSATRGFSETRRPDSTIPNNVWGRNDHRRPERDASPRRLMLPPNPTIFEKQAGSDHSDRGKHHCLYGVGDPPPIPAPTNECQNPAMPRLRTHELEVGCFRFAYAARS